MKLSVMDRFGIIELLPRFGSFDAMKTTTSMRKKVSLTDEEIKRYEVQETQTQTGVDCSWNLEKDVGIEIELTPAECELVASELRIRDQKQTITPSQVHLYELFCGGVNG
jgi:ribosome biogenesis protein Tsr3